MPNPEITESYEYKHLECPQSWVNSVLNSYSQFFWELVGTQTIVSKESHLENGGLFDSNTIYSVTTTERFATVDLRRKRQLSNYEKIKEIEIRYFSICDLLIGLGCSPVNDFSTPPPAKGIGCLGIALYILYVFPGILYNNKIKRENAKKLTDYQQAKHELSKLIAENKSFLNI